LKFKNDKTKVFTDFSYDFVSVDYFTSISRTLCHLNHHF